MTFPALVPHFQDNSLSLVGSSQAYNVSFPGANLSGSVLTELAKTQRIVSNYLRYKKDKHHKVHAKIYF